MRKFSSFLALALGFALAATCGAAAVETRSTFHCVSLYWTRPEAGLCSVHYRVAGDTTWREAQALGYDAHTGTRMMHQYRGSVVNLRPGTRYEFKLTAGGEERLVRAETWNESFKIKKTIRVTDAQTFATTEGGSAADGYVLYDGTGATIDCANAMPHGLVVNHSFVIVRGFAVRGAQQDAVVVAGGLSDVVIELCDISGWGSQRKPAQNPRWGKIEGGIKCGSTAVRVVIQRNKVHHPRYAATKWNEEPEDAHPRGPRAILLGHRSDDEDWESNHVIRYNEFFSDLEHLFEDVVGGGLNYSQTGHPGRDSDIYGNIISHATDDLIEADGGGQNVRIWGNFLTYGNVMVSLQSCSVGPTYIFRNVMDRSMGSLFGEKPARTGFKFVGKTGTPSDRARRVSPFYGPVYVYHNSWLTGTDVDSAFATHPDDHLRNIVSRNNVLPTARYYVADLYDGAKATDPKAPKMTADYIGCSFDYDLVSRDSRGESALAAIGAHGLRGEPAWRKGHGPAAGTGGNYQLADGSPGRNAGAALANFNRGAADEGGAPDMGAHEAGAPPMQFGVDAKWLVP